MIAFDGPLVLYGSTTSPFVRKVRACLLELQTEHTFELTPPWSPTSGVERINPLQKVPALKLADGTLLYDSRVIVQYLDARQPAYGLIPRDPSRRLLALRLEAVADGVGDAAALHIQEGWRAPEARSAFWLDRQRHKVHAGFAAMDEQLAPWMPLAGTPTLAHIAVGAAVGFVSFWMPELAWREAHPRLAELMQSLSSRAAWAATEPYLLPGAKFPSL